MLSLLIGALLEVGILNIKIESAVAMSAPNAHSDNPWTCESADRTTDFVLGRNLDGLFLHRYPAIARAQVSGTINALNLAVVGNR